MAGPIFRGHLVRILTSVTVLPGLQAAFPPIEQKSTAIWRKLTAISNFRKFRYFSAIFGLFVKVNI
jgi:hypothetical protein